jgi:hypothetical protein
MVVSSFPTTTRFAEPIWTIDALQLKTQVLGHDLRPGQHRDVFEHRLAAIAKAWRLDPATFQYASHI